jgi:4-amino-4-deoxy-L-arabinose transferase-like glycosyltransferase
MSDPLATALVGQDEASMSGAAPTTGDLKRAGFPARLRRGMRRLPPAAWACMAVAGLNAACWSLITPPFQTPDEPSHYAYTQDLLETGGLPSSPLEEFSTSEGVALRDLHQPQVRYNPQNHTIFTAAAQHQLEVDLARPFSSVSHSAGVATAEPPLYYALEAIPYYVGSGGTVLDRLALMRLLSSLMAALTAFFVFLFVRETLPGAPWAWTVGGLGAAFAPLLGLMGGSVNPDSLLFAISAALLYLLARGFRRGFTPGLAALSGAAIAIGVITKLSFAGLLPGALLGLVVLTVRARRTSRGAAYRSLALALTIAASLPSIYVVTNLLTGRAAYGTLTSNVTSTTGRSLASELSYIWQFYLPRLPGMHSYFPGILTPVKFWIDGFVGLYGWVDTVFPAWVYELALVPIGLIGVLLLSGIFQGRLSLRSRLSELCVYGTMAIGLASVVGASDYLEYPLSTGSYAQPRYLMPLLALYGAALAVAARGAGRRWGPVVGAAIVIGLIAHDLFSGLLEISRFYG